ncbi:hypothetical protein [Motilibacter deserti]|uniref:Uncharacterized protein n=1 Tax=Motilibacter deserti TaxID=2714956 RepID=A0ABX0GXE3_9ACTN|nr:hypothetical protein [Motilibacter deserti]NHC15233.1 hypothetical protein [Motilibacter deserti]
MSATEPSRAEAEQLLRMVAQTQAQAADRVVTPGWYHPALGLLLALVVAAMGAHNVMLLSPVLAVFVVGIALLVTAYKSQAGVWVGGTASGPRAKRLQQVMLVAIAGLLAVAAVLDHGLGHRWAWPAAAVLVVPLVVVLGRRYDAVYRAEMRTPR